MTVIATVVNAQSPYYYCHDTCCSWRYITIYRHTVPSSAWTVAYRYVHLYRCTEVELDQRFLQSILTPSRFRGGVIFSLQFVCVCVCVPVCLSACQSVCLCVCPVLCLWTKFQPNGCTVLDAVFAKWLLTALTKTLLKLVTLGKRSRSQWLKIHFFSKFSVNFPTVYFSSRMFDQFEIWYAA